MTQEFIAPVPYYILNATEGAALKREAEELRRVVDDPKTPWVARTRAATRLGEVERLLKADVTGYGWADGGDAIERLLKADPTAYGGAHNVAQRTRRVVNREPRIVRLIPDDTGTAFLVENVSPRERPQEYIEPKRP